MYVKKFDADTIDEALKAIKRELGPDAIILKTTTNKGLKGALKKKRVTVTAAISEKTYTKKINVDAVLNEDQKHKFYGNQANYISEMIDNYSEKKNAEKAQTTIPSYGHLGLNRQVKKTSNNISHELDQFLSGEKKSSIKEETISVGQNRTLERENFERNNTLVENRTPSRSISGGQSSQDELQAELALHEAKIDELEKRLYQLTKKLDEVKDHGPVGLHHINQTLRGLGINEKFIQKLSKKAVFELSDEELQDHETVYEFTLREMAGQIQTALPMFSSLDPQKRPVITFLISEAAAGQTSMALKLGALNKNALLVRYGGAENQDAHNLTSKLFDMEIKWAKNLPEIVTLCRQSLEEGRSVFVDFRNDKHDIEETKKFVDGLKRSFNDIDFHLCLSAIHSELYNLKLINKFRSLVNGINFSHFDLCLNFGAIYNAQMESERPIFFWGTGPVVPDDIEAASAERLLSCLFGF